ncbi:MAG: aspartate carbamoyltransferase catalytic subunit [Actinobacteria bacterium]|nr:MAG: aspartate carbamoyltransferase catalytic subunit [Actinomycetota bacterium]
MLSCRHVIDIEDLTPEEIVHVLDTADAFAEVNERQIKKLPTLRGRTVINLFLEPSTRTRTSFEIAAKRLSADAVNFSASSSATVKGESLRDTAKTLSAMACDLVVVRHKYAGAPRILAESMDSCVVNGGDGMHQHPTQALLDLYTMRKALGRLEGLTVGVVGDISHSRVAGSLVPALRMVGATPVVVAPPTLLPSRPDVLGAEVAHDLDEVLPDLDVAYLLRVQMERAEGMPFPSVREYARLYGMNRARMDRLRDGAIVMHPGPMNRGVEISADVADSDRSLVLGQVESGVAVRMAIMYLLLGGEASGAAA